MHIIVTVLSTGSVHVCLCNCNIIVYCLLLKKKIPSSSIMTATEEVGHVLQQPVTKRGHYARAEGEMWSKQQSTALLQLTATSKSSFQMSSRASFVPRNTYTSELQKRWREGHKDISVETVNCTTSQKKHGAYWLYLPQYVTDNDYSKEILMIARLPPAG